MDRFLGELRQGAKDTYASELTSTDKAGPSLFISELKKLLDQGTDILQQIENFIDELEKGIDCNGAKELGKRRRLIWLKGSRHVARWRSNLRAITSNICRLLLAQNV